MSSAEILRSRKRKLAPVVAAMTPRVNLLRTSKTVNKAAFLKHAHHDDLGSSSSARPGALSINVRKGNRGPRVT